MERQCCFGFNDEPEPQEKARRTTSDRLKRDGLTNISFEFRDNPCDEMQFPTNLFGDALKDQNGLAEQARSEPRAN